MANTLSNLPFSPVGISFMAGRHRSIGDFGTFHLVTYPIHYATFFPCLRTLVPVQDFDTLFCISAIFAPDTTQYSGYLVLVYPMERWLFRTYYINPFFSWVSIMESEFSRISLVCEGTLFVFRNSPEWTNTTMLQAPVQLAPSTTLI